MTLRIIDNKRVELTNDEWKTYQEICSSYDKPNFQGKDLFKDIFETNDKGTIIFIRPPKGFTSIEVLYFIQSVMLHQHLRLMYSEIDSAVNEVKVLSKEAKILIDQLKLSSQSK